jgi:hypothetical protein
MKKKGSKNNKKIEQNDQSTVTINGTDILNDKKESIDLTDLNNITNSYFDRLDRLYNKANGSNLMDLELLISNVLDQYSDLIVRNCDKKLKK